METNLLLINIMLFFFLPLWVVAGLVDWYCHRKSSIETTSGIFESLLHSLMGIQIAIPILLCLLFEVSVGIILICIFAWILHEVIAHLDVRYATTKREISILEMHAHSYLSTLPLYMLAMIFVLNWEIVIQLVSFEWEDAFIFRLHNEPLGGKNFLLYFLTFKLIFGVFPYIEELIRCLHAKFNYKN